MLNNLVAMVGGLLLFITKYTDANSESAGLLIIGRVTLGVNAGKTNSSSEKYQIQNRNRSSRPELFFMKRCS